MATAKSLGLGTGAKLLLKHLGADLIAGAEVARLMMPLQYAGDPTNNVTPDFEGQFCTDLTNHDTYVAVGDAAANWEKITG